MRENEKYEFSNEQKLVILCARLTYKDKDIQALDALKKVELNWFEILNYCIKNKVVSLVWYNAKRYGLNVNVPNPIYDIFEYYSYLTGIRNEIIINEAHEVQNILAESNVDCIPLKGLVLIPSLYKDFQIRHMNDIDMMIDIDSRNKVAEPLKKIGYIQGRPDRARNEIKPYQRSELIAWNISMNNMPLFTKITDFSYVKFVEIDFTFGLDYNRQNQAVSTMLKHTYYDDAIKFKCLDKVDFFIHLCSHLYKEATNAVYLIYFQDINLIKFCDVREYFLQNYAEDWFSEVCIRAKYFGVEKALYYSLYYSFLLFDDENDAILDKIGISDYEFMDSFGKHEWGRDYKWNKSFYERLFSQNNMDEISEKPEIKLI